MTDQLFTAIQDAADYLERRGVKQAALPRRDRREPGRRRKEAAEYRLYTAVMRYFRRQEKRIRARLEAWFPERKSMYDGMFDDAFSDEEAYAAILRVIMASAQDGVALFGEMTNIGLDYTLVNTQAADWARRYTFDLVKGIDNTTRKALQDAIGAFVDVPGFTIRDVVNLLPYSEKRAMMVAVTEITRAYHEANMFAGRELQKEFPDVVVVKRFYTNADDRVCEICGPLDGKVVNLEEEFAEGVSGPPLHPRCRCWSSTTTRLADND
jgi:SPP1 gp7 family putative phage head morphogenesis protein